MDTSDQVASENYKTFMNLLEKATKISLAELNSARETLSNKAIGYREQIRAANDQMAKVESLTEQLKDNIRHEMAISKADGLFDFADERVNQINEMLKDFKITDMKEAPKLLAEMDNFKEMLSKEREIYLHLGKPESFKETFKAKIDSFLPPKEKNLSKSPLNASKSIIGKSFNDILKQASTKPLKAMTKAVVKDMSDDFGLVR